MGGLLLLTGAGIGYSALQAAVDLMSAASPAEVAFTLRDATTNLDPLTLLRDALPGPDAPDGPSSWAKAGALSVSAIGILVKEALFRYTLKAGKRANSSAVVANAWQHRSDAGVATGVFVGLAGSMMGYPMLDPIAAFLVSGVIVRQGVVIGTDALKVGLRHL